MFLPLMASRLSLHASAQALAQMDDGALKRRAVTAARDYDTEGLWEVLAACLVLRGKRGAKVSPRTLEAYRQGLDDLLTWARPAGVELMRPKPNMGYAYVRHLEGLKLTPSSVGVKLAAARALYAALRWAGATEASPFTDVRAAPDLVPKWEKRQPYTLEAVDKLLAVADPQERVIVLLGADCGLRNAEMRGLQRSDVHLGGERPHVRVTGKGDRIQAVDLSSRAEAALKHWIEQSPMLAPWVLSMRNASSMTRMMQGLCARAGVEYAGHHLHGLRHTCGTRLYVETKDLIAVRDHLRHSNVETSEVYVHYAAKGGKAKNRDW